MFEKLCDFLEARPKANRAFAFVGGLAVTVVIFLALGYGQSVSMQEALAAANQHTVLANR
ncbi:MAG: hypothetical protein P4L81_04935 [Candidatus Pacebacteria bacterium]|nr:hypothetical protein [Candidatus Paceibacterota bacterium]